MKNFINKYSITITIIVVAIFAIFFFRNCKGKNTEKPIFTNPKLIVDSQSVEVKLKNVIIDSLKKQNNIISSNNDSLKRSLSQLKLSEKDLASDLRKQNQPEVIKYIEVSEKRDSICDSIVSNQSEQISIKDQIILQKDILYSDINKRFNFLADQSTKQLAYEKTLQPTNQVYIGGGLFGSQSNILGGASLGLIFKNKQDNIWKASVTSSFQGILGLQVEKYFKIHL